MRRESAGGDPNAHRRGALRPVVPHIRIADAAGCTRGSTVSSGTLEDQLADPVSL